MEVRKKPRAPIVVNMAAPCLHISQVTLAWQPMRKLFDNLSFFYSTPNYQFTGSCLCHSEYESYSHTLAKCFSYPADTTSDMTQRHLGLHAKVHHLNYTIGKEVRRIREFPPLPAWEAYGRSGSTWLVSLWLGVSLNWCSGALDVS